MKKRLIVVVTCLSLSAVWASNGPKLNLVTGHYVELSVFREGAQLFSNRPYRAPKLPSLLDGQTLVVAPIDGFQIDCLTDGRLYALVPETPYHKDVNIAEALVQQGFERVADVPVFQLFGANAWERVVTLRRDVRASEHFNVAKWAVFLGAGAVERSKRRCAGRRPEMCQCTSRACTTTARLARRRSGVTVFAAWLRTATARS